jgi:hypothetical protein
VTARHEHTKGRDRSTRTSSQHVTPPQSQHHVTAPRHSTTSQHHVTAAQSSLRHTTHVTHTHTSNIHEHSKGEGGAQALARFT